MTMACVVTSIQAPTRGVREIAVGMDRVGEFIVVGDRKSPDTWECDGVRFLSYAQQLEMNFRCSAVIPANSYARKMLGYLLAFSNGVQWIRETDDDNSPYASFFDEPPEFLAGREPSPKSKWVNIYSFFTDRAIWPRGLPLQHSRRSPEQAVQGTVATGLVVLQAVADGDPDVDAVYRLTAPDTSDVIFDQAEPLIIRAGTWTPFNSQATTWPVELLPLMYLPSTCSFRMTDIWRSYVAQRLMPTLGATLVITGPIVFQDRNEHDLMRDFHDEIEGYVGYERLVQVLEDTPVAGGVDSVLSDLRGLYVALIAAGFFTSDEMPILDAWIADMETLGFGPTA
jgi:hypothetical protein